LNSKKRETKRRNKGIISFSELATISQYRMSKIIREFEMNKATMITVLLETIETCIKEITKETEKKDIKLPCWKALQEGVSALKKEIGEQEEHVFFIKIYDKGRHVGYFCNTHSLRDGLSPFKIKSEDFRNSIYAQIFTNSTAAITTANEYLNSFPEEKDNGLECVVKGVL
jgi:hypothetical protein